MICFSEASLGWQKKGLEFLEQLGNKVSQGRRDLYYQKSLHYGVDGSEILLAKKEYERLAKEHFARINKGVFENKKKPSFIDKMFVTKKWLDNVVGSKEDEDDWRRISQLVLFTAELDFEVDPWIIIRSSIHSQEGLVVLIKSISSQINLDLEHDSSLTPYSS